MSILLRGLKQVTDNVTAIVSVGDDGGGSGILREDLGMLPPGDIRACILALANTEPLMEDLIQYRFKEGQLSGQNFGNLMLAAMVGISDNFEDAIQKFSDIFAITGRVLPVTTSEMILKAKLSDGSWVTGESKIPRIAQRRGARIEELLLEGDQPSALEDAILAILNADIVVLGPGSLYTSVIPNLLVDGVREALQVTEAKRIYVPNIMTQPGETDGYTVKDHVHELMKHSAMGIVDFVFANTTVLDLQTARNYAAEKSYPVELTQMDRQWLSDNHIGVIEGSFCEVYKGYVRHDAAKMADHMVTLIDTKVYRNKRYMTPLDQT